MSDITNQYESAQTLDVSAGTSNLSAVQNSEFTTTTMNCQDSKLVPKVVPPADKTATSRQELELLFHHHITMLRSYALSWKPCQGDSLNLPDHRNDIKMEICEAELKKSRMRKDFCANSDIKDNFSEIKLRGRLLASFQDDAKYEHVGQDTRSQGGKDDQTTRKDLKISEHKDEVERQ
ncbi:hypothetical protein Tco_0838003 [Tanacetum coccineum]